VLFSLFLIYPKVCSTILNMYVCRYIEGEYLLLSDFNILCYDSRWWFYFPTNLVGVILYPFGVPLCFLILLFRYRKQFNVPGVRLQLGFLYDGYTTYTWWFELVDVMHKLIMTCILPFIPTQLQMPFGMVVAMSYLVLILLRSPYYRKGDDRLHQLAQVELFLLLLAGYIFYNGLGLDFKSDLLMSIFLVVVVLGFIGLFFAQSANIFRKLFRECRNSPKGMFLGDDKDDDKDDEDDDEDLIDPPPKQSSEPQVIMTTAQLFE